MMGTVLILFHIFVTVVATVRLSDATRRVSAEAITTSDYPYQTPSLDGPSQVVLFPYNDNKDNVSSTSVQQPIPPVSPPLTPSLPAPHINSESSFGKKLFALDGKSYDRYGHVVATDGSSVFVATQSEGLAGKVYVHKLSEDNQWVEVNQIRTHNPFDGFAKSIVAVDDILVIAAPDDSTIAPHGGTVRVFSNQDKKPPQPSLLKPPRPQPNGFFGSSISACEGFLLVGAKGEHEGPDSTTGAVYLFALSSLGR